MAQRNRSSLKTVANSRFADNSSGAIEEVDHRDQHGDNADSFLTIEDDAYRSFSVTAAGTDTYTATLSPAITAYSDGQKFFVKFTNANTGAATLNFNSVGAKSIVKNGSTALALGDIAAGQAYLLMYDGANLQIIGKFSSATGTIGGSTGATDNAILTADGTGGATLQNSALTISDAGLLSGLTGIQGSTYVNGNLKVGTGSGTSADRRLHAEVDDSVTGAVSYAVKFGHNISGTPTAGAGTGIELACETSAGNHEVGATIEAVTTDVTAGSEDFDLAFKTMSAGAAASERLRVTSDGRVYGTALHNNAGAITGTTNQYIASGTYTPTLTASTNVASTTAYEMQFIRVGNVVNFSGWVGVTATATNTATALSISLPIVPNNFSSNVPGGGTGYALVSPGLDADANSESCALHATNLNNVMTMKYYAKVTSARIFVINATYLIV